jgi:DNA-binding SARP family transcriptional activator
MSLGVRRSYRCGVEFGVLGPLVVTRPPASINIAGVKERTLLAHLIACAGRMVTTDDLIDSLWKSAPPRSAAKSLQTYVMRLRNTLEPGRRGAAGLIVTDGPGYRLDVGDDEIDARRFVRLVELGQRAGGLRRLASDPDDTGRFAIDRSTITFTGSADCREATWSDVRVFVDTLYAAVEGPGCQTGPTTWIRLSSNVFSA